MLLLHATGLRVSCVYYVFLMDGSIRSRVFSICFSGDAFSPNIVSLQPRDGFSCNLGRNFLLQLQDAFFPATARWILSCNFMIHSFLQPRDGFSLTTSAGIFSCNFRMHSLLQPRDGFSPATSAGIYSCNFGMIIFCNSWWILFCNFGMNYFLLLCSAFSLTASRCRLFSGICVELWGILCT